MKLAFALFAAYIVFAAQTASASTIFLDDFQSGSLSASLWSNTGSGFVTTDPTNNANDVLTFGLTGSGGDVFSVLMPDVAGTYQLSFDFYEAQSETPENIGYVGTDHQTFPWGPNEQWVWNASSATAGQWNHVSLSITPLTNDPFDLKLEAGSIFPGQQLPFDVYFDNITLTDSSEPEPVPEPASVVLVGMGVLAMASRLRRARVKA